MVTIGGQGRFPKPPHLVGNPRSPLSLSASDGHQLSTCLRKCFPKLRASDTGGRRPLWGAMEAEHSPPAGQPAHVRRRPIFFDRRGVLSAPRAAQRSSPRSGAFRKIEGPGEGIRAFSMKKIGVGVFYGKNQSCRARRAEHYGTRVSPVS